MKLVSNINFEMKLEFNALTLDVFWNSYLSPSEKSKNIGILENANIYIVENKGVRILAITYVGAKKYFRGFSFLKKN